jgi:hypothetical protein
MSRSTLASSVAAALIVNSKGVSLVEAVDPPAIDPGVTVALVMVANGEELVMLI